MPCRRKNCNQHYNAGKHDNYGRGTHYGGQRQASDDGKFHHNEGHGEFYFNKGSGKYYYKNYNVDRGGKEYYADKGHKLDYQRRGEDYNKGYYTDRDNYNNYYNHNGAQPQTYDDNDSRFRSTPSTGYYSNSYRPRYRERGQSYTYEPQYETYTGYDDDSYGYNSNRRYIRDHGANRRQLGRYGYSYIGYQPRYN